jgi:hypothetical protein
VNRATRIGIEREQRRQDLERDIAIELGIASAIHLAHRARADQRDDVVRSDSFRSRRAVNGARGDGESVDQAGLLGV